jgi:hypothetical protein
MTRIVGRFALLLGFLLLGAAAGHAADMLTGSEIKTLVSGNTITGTMIETGNYAEFYQPDGVIKGNGYAGLWSVSSDSICFKYGSDPLVCRRLGWNGDQLQWMSGKRLAGTGMVVPGNPNNY